MKSKKNYRRLHIAILTILCFGAWNPASIYSNVSLKASAPHIVSAILFDSMRGLIITCPILAIIFVGSPICFKERRESFLSMLFVIFPTMFILSTFNFWQGGDSPIGRYVLDFLPVLIPAIGFALVYAKAHMAKICNWY